MGSITTRLNEDEFEVIESPEQIQAKTKNVSKKVTSKVKAQLDLRGMRYEEAELELDNYIDQALLANLIQITIVHGIGTGVIREMVQKKLQKHRHNHDLQCRRKGHQRAEKPRIRRQGRGGKGRHGH